mgnify:CR=1 FL=1
MTIGVTKRNASKTYGVWHGVTYSKHRSVTMGKYLITYTDVIIADNIDEAEDILMEQLMMDVRANDASAFEITEAEQDDG